MATVPVWLTMANGLVTATITPQVHAGAGVLTPAAGVSLVAQIEEVRPRFRKSQENINAGHRTRANYVTLETDTELEIIEILKFAGVNILASLYMNYEFAQFLFTRGDQSLTLLMVLGDYDEGYRKGKSVGTLTCKQVDDLAGVPVLYTE